ncbi:MAG: O-acetyl-ADP-ribose deacetylase [Phycisphaerales bacterium]|nr:O-acetyl-ADP-ribose deacetylase [Phycisphaerales bacterium]
MTDSTTVWNRISLIRGDITTQPVDAIVNAANSRLAGGGGVDGAIHRAAGPQMMDACRKIGGCPTGSAKLTPGFNLPARFVIHAVGPVYRDGLHGEPEALASCYRTAIELAAENGCETVAFSAISCGIYGYPLEAAARVSIDAVAGALGPCDRPEKVWWVLFDERVHRAFAAALLESAGQDRHGVETPP